MKKYSVVHNTAISGGICLSEEAVLWLKERGFPYYIQPKEIYRCSVSCHRNVTIPRHDPFLVECILPLGERANGFRQRMKIRAEMHVTTIEGKYHWIVERDGAGEAVIDISMMVDASVRHN